MIELILSVILLVFLLCLAYEPSIDKIHDTYVLWYNSNFFTKKRNYIRIYGK